MGAKCIFLDRDGVINVDKVDYTYTLEDFKIIPGVIEALEAFKKAGYLLVVITNQSGIAKGIYGHEDVKICHDFFQEKCGCLIDRYYYSPYHQTISESISRKPDSLMFEKAIAKFDIDIESSWMIGDKNRDLVPAKKLGIKTVLVGHEEPYPVEVDIKADDLKKASELILQA
ncbi:D-glycero-alpha-D-manno-heptose-1,7-bisphosphate 7-phosphatase [Sporocytophaga myxococcoides]|uniref:D-glycero-alpha-D-manno-heptose-1,7-bisphosphate 7-phosphatase n=1 Tax=Sporocytophaga myxococcoides TaxID=153721 RepID=UPI00041CD20F|nr:HAD family hydrolase [Sporocytophaga myxococcoides]